MGTCLSAGAGGLGEGSPWGKQGVERGTLCALRLTELLGSRLPGPSSFCFSIRVCLLFSLVSVPPSVLQFVCLCPCRSFSVSFFCPFVLCGASFVSVSPGFFLSLCISLSPLPPPLLSRGLPCFTEPQGQAGAGRKLELSPSDAAGLPEATGSRDRARGLVNGWPDPLPGELGGWLLTGCGWVAEISFTALVD